LGRSAPRHRGSSFGVLRRGAQSDSPALLKERGFLSKGSAHMIAMITAALELATTTLGFIQSERLMGYVREIKNDRDELAEEIAKGSKANHPKIEALYEKIPRTFAALNQQIAILQASKGSASIGIPGASSK
jgi:hypothetical protein